MLVESFLDLQQLVYVLQIEHVPWPKNALNFDQSFLL